MDTVDDQRLTQAGKLMQHRSNPQRDRVIRHADSAGIRWHRMLGLVSIAVSLTGTIATAQPSLKVKKLGVSFPQRDSTQSVYEFVSYALSLITHLTLPTNREV